jgi:predicted Zn-dependent protease
VRTIEVAADDDVEPRVLEAIEAALATRLGTHVRRSAAFPDARLAYDRRRRQHDSSVLLEILASRAGPQARVMSLSTDVDQVDAKDMAYCQSCRSQLDDLESWRSTNEGDVPEVEP